MLRAPFLKKKKKENYKTSVLTTVLVIKPTESSTDSVAYTFPSTTVFFFPPTELCFSFNLEKTAKISIFFYHVMN